MTDRRDLRGARGSARPATTGEALALALGTTADFSGGRAREIEAAARSLVLEPSKEGLQDGDRRALGGSDAKQTEPHRPAIHGDGFGARIMAAPYDH